MKIYNPEPKDLIRLQIVKQKHETQYLTLCECTADEAKTYIQSLIKDKVSVFPEESRTTIHVREAKGAVNGKSRSFYFYGLTPREVYDLILKKLDV